MFKLRTGVALLGMVILALTARSSWPQAGRATAEEFFIISTVDLRKKQIVLKRPTEVTLLLQVTDKTSFKNLEGKAIQLKDLRAGDTVYVRYSKNAQGNLSAESIRIGIMTQRELYHRYLKGIPLTSWNA